MPERHVSRNIDTYPGGQPVLTAAAMREADRISIEEYGIPGPVLMENAGRATADVIEMIYGAVAGKTILICCGKGNNGGDGLVIGRVLYARGASVDLALAFPEDQCTGDAALNLNLVRRLVQEDVESRIRLEYVDDPAGLDRFSGADLLVDALVGTGLSSNLRAPLDGWVEWLNRQSKPCIAVDIPSGLNSDSGQAPGPCVRADLTVTMAALKTGLLINDGPSITGAWETVEIGIPGYVLDQVNRQHGDTRLVTPKYVRNGLPLRMHTAHKYSVGLALVVAGSPGLTGAPVMASTAAARAGAGAVVCACPHSVQPLLAGKMTEVMTLGLPETDQGIDPEPAISALQSRLEKAKALLIGCGLGTRPDTGLFVRSLLEQVELPVVVDADGLNALAGHTDLVRTRSNGRWILTPHAGEFERLAGSHVDLTDRVAVAREYARVWNCIVLLKGMPSVAGCPDGRVWINATGGPALATAGTGDVLAGLCVGFLAQGLEPEQAVATAMYLGGAAADRYTAQHSARTMMATDLFDEIPSVMFDLNV